MKLLKDTRLSAPPPTKGGTFEVEVLPPPSPELERSVERIHGKYKDAFAEMKRLGD